MKSTKHSATELTQSAMRATERERDAWKLAMGEPDTIPEGWRTSAQWGALWGKSPARSKEIIRTLISKKLMTFKKFRQVNDDGRAVSCPHYKLV